MSPSPAPSYALMPIAPMSEGGGSSPFMSLGSPTPSALGEGWRRPEQYVGGPEDRCSLFFNFYINNL
jgi:hypothetical protein